MSSQLQTLLEGLLTKDQHSRTTLQQVLLSDWVMDQLAYVDVTDLINPAFLANKYIVQQML